MSDVLEMIRSGVSKEENKREQIRREFPACTSIVDEFREVFGPGVKPLYFNEAGKTMGKPQPFDGTDADKLLRYYDMADKRRAKGAR